MTRPFNKKHFWLIVGVVAFLEVLIICLVLQWKYLFPSREVSELYARYADVEGVEASFIKDYRVNDSVFVDVTVLEATTDSAWENLMNVFDLGKDSGTNSLNRIVAWRSPNGKPTEHAQPTSPDDWGVAAVPGKKYISIFHSKNEEEITAISFYIFQNILNTRP